MSSASGTYEVEEQREDREHLDDDDEQEDRAEGANRRISAMSELDARQQLARLPAVVEADVEALQVLVEVVAELGLDVGRDVRERRGAGGT